MLACSAVDTSVHQKDLSGGIFNSRSIFSILLVLLVLQWIEDRTYSYHFRNAVPIFLLIGHCTTRELSIYLYFETRGQRLCFRKFEFDRVGFIVYLIFPFIWGFFFLFYFWRCSFTVRLICHFFESNYSFLIHAAINCIGKWTMNNYRKMVTELSYIFTIYHPYIIIVFCILSNMAYCF